MPQAEAIDKDEVTLATEDDLERSIQNNISDRVSAYAGVAVDVVLVVLSLTLAEAVLTLRRVYIGDIKDDAPWIVQVLNTAPSNDASTGKGGGAILVGDQNTRRAGRDERQQRRGSLGEDDVEEAPASDPFCTPALPACARDESLGSEPTFNARRRFARGDMGGLLGRTLMVRDQDDPHSPGLGVQAQSFKPAPVSRCHTQSFGGSSFAFASRPSRAQNEQPSERTRQFRPGRLLALRSPRGNCKQAMASSGAGQSAQGASDLL